MERIIRQLRQRFSEYDQDNDARFELRQGVFLLVIVCSLLYLFFFLWVEPKEKLNRSLHSRKTQLQGSTGGPQLEEMLSAELARQMTEQQGLTEHIAFLRFQERMLHEQYPDAGGAPSFANIVFSLLSTAPVDLENSVVQLSVLEREKMDFYDVSPVRLQGTIDYSQFLDYLCYLEDRTEVGMIGDISLESGDLIRSGTGPGQVRFDMVLGRIELHSHGPVVVNDSLQANNAVTGSPVSGGQP